jgi:23S rRNA (guanosine2251-2'-O)-methyltransferase
MIVYGKQIVFYILEKHPKLIEEIFLTKEIEPKLFRKFMNVGAKVIRPDNKKAQALAKGGNHQGFLLKIKPYEFASVEDVKKKDFVVVLDGLNDVGNIGAIVRTAYALGADALIVSGMKNLNVAPVVRTSSGAMLDMPITVIPNCNDLMNELKQLNFTRVGASMDGVEVSTLQRSKGQKVALFLGSEGDGLSGKVKKKLDVTVSIDMCNDFDSLNVSVAAGILIHSLIKIK